MQQSEVYNDKYLTAGVIVALVICIVLGLKLHFLTTKVSLLEARNQNIEITLRSKEVQYIESIEWILNILDENGMNRIMEHCTPIWLELEKDSSSHYNKCMTLGSILTDCSGTPITEIVVAAKDNNVIEFNPDSYNLFLCEH